MPAFREGPVIVDRGFDGRGLHALREIEYGGRITIANETYDVPDPDDIPGEVDTVFFDGDSAGALLGIARLIPIARREVMFMGPDKYADDYGLVSFQAYHSFREAAARLDSETGIFLILDQLETIVASDLISFRPDTPTAADFHEHADFPGEPEELLYVRTRDPRPFACATFTVGRSYDPNTTD